MFLFYSLSAALLTILLANPVSGGSNTTCAGSALNWYTTTVGETPCMTYQRLRQICNSEYEVPSFRPNTPGDNCDDQLSACCCNSISWALSMLCMNCQWDTPSSSANGIDAGVPAYYMYRFSDTNGQYCGDGTNQSLSTNIQEAVCNEGIKIQSVLYSLFWNTGAWYYTYTREAAQQDEASNGDNIYYCSSSTTSSATSSTSTTAVVASPSSNPSTSVSQAPAPSETSPSSSGTYSSSSPAFGASTTGPESRSSASSTADHSFSSSFVTTLESQTTVDGTATSVPYVTTVVTTAPSSPANGTAVGLGATGSGRKVSTGAIAGGVVGGLVGLLLLGVAGGWFARRQRKGVAGPVLRTDPSVGGSSNGPLSPNMVERNPITPFVARESTNDPFASPAPPAAGGKWERMQQNTSGYTLPSSTSGSGTGSGSVPSTGTGSREALSLAHRAIESSSSYSQVDVVAHATGPIVQEEDAGRFSVGIRLPPAYQSEWNAE